MIDGGILKRRDGTTRLRPTGSAIGQVGTGLEEDVDRNRRGLIAAGGAFLSLMQVGLLGSARAETFRHDDLFSATTLDEALAALGSTPIDDVSVDEVSVEVILPEVVEDGAVVPVTVSSTLAGVEEIYVLIPTNPYPVAVRFEIPDGTEPFVSIRLKLAQSGAVYAVVRAKGRLYARVAETRVTVGGCA
ncbi:thiosulfate oxidation carrier protein SoxY [Thiocapsa sp.]|uniref:thiosulfate oxidation carrier protein SoxY n=1 Tax=Thiocapsa sp. TaxID=2024551 RepID=UPI002CA2F4C7|nr:thiosulfate oxidation carrier protein SoxY [Thiocapsa sp.]HSO83858.1 thiosulfate oxidation carrier protein SoxY [Thiocapsa sp.]